MGYCECAEKSESGDDAVLYEAMGATILQATPREETHSSIKDISRIFRTIVKLLATSKNMNQVSGQNSKPNED